jgi:hypothetical protein
MRSRKNKTVSTDSGTDSGSENSVDSPHPEDYEHDSNANSSDEYDSENENVLDLSKFDEEHQREISIIYHKFGHLIKKTAIGSTPYIKKAFAVSSIYLFWILLHFITAQMYVRYCAHPSLYGLLISPFLISAPHCAAMRWVFTKGGTLIDGMWILLGTWLCSKVIYRDV